MRGTVNLSCRNINIVLLSLFSIFEALQVLIIVSYISYFIPIHAQIDIFIPEKPPEPTRAILLYRFFVAVIVFVFAGSVFLKRRQLDSRDLSVSLGKFLVWETIITALISLSFFKLIMGGPVSLANRFFYSTLVLTLLFKLFCLTRRKLAPFYQAVALWVSQKTYLERLIDFAIFPLIIALVYIPDRAGLFGKILAIDQLYHNDIFIMAPAWGYLKGCALNYDMFSQYANGLPIVFAHLSRLIGGFSYENVLLLMSIMIMGYCLMLYVFVRLWLKDVLLAAIAVVLYLKIQVFNNDPYMLLYPSRSAVRFLFDLPVFWLILKHSRQPQKRYLAAAGFLVGLAMVYLTDIGIYLYMVLAAYILVHFVRQDTRDVLCRSARDVLWISMYLLLPLAVGAGAMYMLIGNKFASLVFWENTFGFIKDSVYGFGTIPFYQNLQEGRIYMFAMSCVFPLVYLIFLLYAAAQFVLNNADRKIFFILMVSVYGLLTYHYHVWRSVWINYYVMSGPFILLMMYALGEGLSWFKKESIKVMKIGILLTGIAVLLLTPHVWQSPNVFNFTRHSLDLNKQFIVYQLSIDQDIKLITRLTGPGEEVCLLSSFETLTLMKADRKPFFSKFPIIKSSLFMDVETHGLTINTNKDLNQILSDIDQKAPAYVFVEKKFLRYALSPSEFMGPSMAMIVRHVLEHYVYIEEGLNLVAFRKKLQP